MALVIYGASDDLVEIEGHFEEEVDCYDRAVRVTVGWPEASAGEDSRGVHVLMRYAPKWVETGVWTAEISPLDEDVEIPWPVTVKLGGRGYTAEVHIDCPEDVPVTFKKLKV